MTGLVCILWCEILFFPLGFWRLVAPLLLLCLLVGGGLLWAIFTPLEVSLGDDVAASAFEAHGSKLGYVKAFFF